MKYLLICVSSLGVEGEDGGVGFGEWVLFSGTFFVLSQSISNHISQFSALKPEQNLRVLNSHGLV